MDFTSSRFIPGETIAFDPSLFGFVIFDWDMQDAWFYRTYMPGSSDLTPTAFAKDSEVYKFIEGEVEEDNRLLGPVEGRRFAIVPFTRKAIEDWEAECKAKGDPRVA